jgi:hypothetical protein
MKRKFWAVALVLMMATAVWARPRPDVLILPIEMPGFYNPLDSAGLTKELQSDLAKLGPDVTLQVSRDADLTAYGYTAGAEQPPSADMAEKICRAYGATHLCWVSIRFSPDYQSDAGALALGGAARFWAYSGVKHQVMIDQPISLVRVGQLKDVANKKAARAVAESLANGLVSDLAYQIAGIARQRNQQPPAGVSQWTAPATNSATTSANYKAMLSAAQAYQKAVKNQSLIDITTTQADMTRAWTVLNQNERNAIKQSYPDLERAMTAPVNYNYGGGYWPYRYGY